MPVNTRSDIYTSPLFIFVWYTITILISTHMNPFYKKFLFIKNFSPCNRVVKTLVTQGHYSHDFYRITINLFETSF